MTDIVERLRNRAAYETCIPAETIMETAAQEIERLRTALRYEENRRFNRIGTQADGCWARGPSRYECALREIERLRQDLADETQRWKNACELTNKAEQRIKELEQSHNEASELFAGCVEGQAELRRKLTELLKAQGEPVGEVIQVPPHFLGIRFAYPGVCVPGQKLYASAAPTAHAPTFREPDLHTPGIYVVLDADGAPVLETVDTTGYSARATFVREKNLLWSKAQEQGYRVVELRPV